MDIVPEPAVALALKVVLAPLQIGLAAKDGDAVGLALTDIFTGVKTEEQLLI